MAGGSAEDWYRVAEEAQWLLYFQGYLELNKAAIPAHQRDQKRDAWYKAQMDLAEKLAAVKFRALEADELKRLEAFRKQWAKSRGES